MGFGTVLNEAMNASEENRRKAYAIKQQAEVHGQNMMANELKMINTIKTGRGIDANTNATNLASSDAHNLAVGTLQSKIRQAKLKADNVAKTGKGIDARTNATNLASSDAHNYSTALTTGVTQDNSRKQTLFDKTLDYKVDEANYKAQNVQKQGALIDAKTYGETQKGNKTLAEIEAENTKTADTHKLAVGTYADKVREQKGKADEAVGDGMVSMSDGRVKVGTEQDRIKTEIAIAQRKAQEAKNATQLALSQAKTADIVANSGSVTDTQIVQQTLEQGAKQVKNMENNTNLKDFSGIFVDEHIAGNGFTDFDMINQYVGNDKVLQQIMPRGVDVYNNVDPKHQKAIDDAVSKLPPYKIDTADETIPNFKGGVEALAEKGVLAFNPHTGEMLDIMGMFNSMGYNKKMSPSKNKAMQETTASIFKEGADKGAKPNPVFDEKYSLSYLDRDREDLDRRDKEIEGQTTTLKDRQALIDAELNKQRALGGKPEDINIGGKPEDVEAMTPKEQTARKLELLDKAEQGELTADERAEYETLANSGKATDIRKIDMERLTKSNTNRILKKVNWEDTEPLDKDTRKNLLDIEQRNKSKFSKDEEKLYNEINTNMEFSDQIDSIMEDLKEVTSKDGSGLITGHGSTFVKEIGAKDVTLFTELMNKVRGIKDPEKSKKAKVELYDKLINTVGVNTKVGKLLASYIKETSGAGVTEGEREFLTAVLIGAESGDPRVMAKALSTFQSVIVDSAKRKVRDPRYNTRMPYTLNRIREKQAPKATIDDVNGNKSVGEGIIDAREANTDGTSGIDTVVDGVNTKLDEVFGGTSEVAQKQEFNGMTNDDQHTIIKNVAKKFNFSPAMEGKVKKVFNKLGVEKGMAFLEAKVKQKSKG